MYVDRLAEGNITQVGACREISQLLGVNPATLRGWVRRQRGEGVTPPVGAEPVDAEVVRLRRENAQLKRANEILKTASAFFAAAELDRKLGQ
jgi:transposase-like protein